MIGAPFGTVEITCLNTKQGFVMLAHAGIHPPSQSTTPKKT